MGYVAALLDVTARRCVVVGGGATAVRRTRALLDAGARVIVIAERLQPELIELAERGRIEVYPTPARERFVNARLVYVTEPESEMAGEALAQARAVGAEINVSDRAQQCSFISPAIVKRGRLQIAVSTGGASPALAALVRDEIARLIGDEHAALAEILAAIRPRLKQREPDLDRRAELAAALAIELRDALRQESGDARIREILDYRLGATDTPALINEYQAKPADSQ